MADDLAPDFGIDAARLWSPTWVTIARGRSSRYVADCQAGSDTCPVYWIDPHNMRPEEYWTVRARSLGEMVTLWMSALAEGWWRYNVTDQQWLRGQNIPDEISSTGLV
jgi:hypothetical protein